MDDLVTMPWVIIWGVISGLLASALLFLSGLIMSKIVLPAYQNFIYKGVDLRGVWVCDRDITNNGKFSVQLSLSQNSHNITGTGTLSKSGTGKNDYVQFFSIEGSTWEGFLTINMRSTNRKSLSFVAGLLKVKSRGEILEGHWVYRAASVDEAVSEEILLTRQSTS